MLNMHDFLKMMEMLDHEANNQTGRIGKRTYVNEFDALCHARAVSFLERGQIVRFMIDGKSVFGVFHCRNNKGVCEVYFFDKKDGDMNNAALSPDSILEILNFEELEKRLA